MQNEVAGAQLQQRLTLFSAAQGTVFHVPSAASYARCTTAPACTCLCSQQDDKDKERLKAGLTGAILHEKPNVKVWQHVPATDNGGRQQQLYCLVAPLGPLTMFPSHRMPAHRDAVGEGFGCGVAAGTALAPLIPPSTHGACVRP
jgi:hypothetical protein